MASPLLRRNGLSRFSRRFPPQAKMVLRSPFVGVETACLLLGL